MKTPERVYPKVSRYLGGRMKAKRDYAESRNTKYTGTGRDLTWRDVTWCGKNPYIVGPKSADRLTYGYDDQLRVKTIYLDRFESLGVVVRDSADGYTDRESTVGYYTDDYQDTTVRFVVVRIRTKRGPLYMAGMYHTGCDGVTLFPGNAQMPDLNADADDIDDVIRTVWEWARRLAERSAEFEREENAKEEARDKVVDLRAERADLIKNFRQAKRALRKARAIVETDSDALPLLTIARDRVGEVLRERRHINDKISKLIRDNPAAFA